MVRESAGGDEDEGDEEFDDDTSDREGNFVRLVIGSRILKRRRVRRAVLAHLLKERADSDDTDEESEGEEDADLERAVARLLVGRRVVRHRRMRRALAAHLRGNDD
jgi:hypothetical protein